MIPWIFFFETTLIFKGQDPTTKEYWRRLHEKSAEVVKDLELDQIHYEDFDPAGMVLIQKLLKAGFSCRQINCISPLIRQGFSYESLVKCFGVKQSVKEMEDFVGRVIKYGLKESEVLV